HGLSMVDADQRLVLFNKRFLEMYDLSSEVVRIGMPMADLIAHSAARGNFPAAQLEGIKRRRADLMARGLPFRLLRQMSRGRTFAMDYRPLPGGGWVTLVEDITERQRKDYAMRVQYERFDQAINHMSHGLCMFGPDERLIACNAQHHEMYGLDPEVIKPGVTLREVIAHWIAVGNAPDMSAEEFYEQRKAAVTGRSLSTTQLKLKDGRVIEQTSRSTPDGGWVSAHEDVTERVRAAESLRQQNFLFGAALEDMAHALCMFDKNWRVVVHNRRFLELYGLPSGAVKPGTPVLDLVRFSKDNRVHALSDESPEDVLEDFK